MLYQLHEFQKALLQPMSSWARAASEAFINASNPASKVPGSERLAASYELLHRLGKDYKKPEFGIRSVQAHGREVAIHERTIVAKPFCNLIRFKRFSDDLDAIKKLKGDPAVLVVAPLSGHHSTLLRDTVRTLLQDHKVYITDWIDARIVPAEDGSFSLDDYVHYIQDFIRAIGADDLHVISVCQPTVPTLGAISLMASAGEKTPASMIMMGGPIDARKSPTAVNNLADQKSYDWFESHVIYKVPPSYPGAGRKVYPGFLQHTGFIAMNPQNHMQSHWDFFQNLVRGDEQDAASHIRFYDEYNAVLDMDAQYYLDTIKTVFQDYALPNGTWAVSGDLVKPQDIKKTALLTVEGELDDISGSGQTRAAHALCAGIPKADKDHYEVAGAGHYGIFSGRRWREKVYPKIKSFIREHQGVQKKTRARPPKLEGSKSA
ncbi:polyhydroxyalkanoate depolymerase, intracellular [Polynucleobacter duraquae]|uniref:Polyhydroxyalkanoate depolymerase, intracellular n=1 Tax=Polynucleobacter duraquae TaxID=1835254 RepID=A0A0E3ZMS9_9BURK|nr:polyhydroxyalkanoate depolymerase [Polynucleobacter duraquae]AKD25797.1 polyhydroxyalkanoate depolymerase, intracellular [Polynucleobacter duraquae]